MRELAPAARGSREAGFTQPKVHLFPDPHDRISVPFKITGSYDLVKIVIVAQFGAFSTEPNDDAPKQRIDLEGNLNHVNGLLKNLIYSNEMYDSIAYFDTVTV